MHIRFVVQYALKDTFECMVGLSTCVYVYMYAYIRTYLEINMRTQTRTHTHIKGEKSEMEEREIYTTKCICACMYQCV